MKKFLLFLIVLISSKNLFSQRKCATMDVHKQLVQEHPEFESHLHQIENFTHRFIEQGNYNKTTNVITIPVVVHVVYYNSTQNISDAQIQSQINVLNQDFRNLNADKNNRPSLFSGLAADIQIEFCLAQRTPTGQATNGIIRKQTTVNGFSTDDKMKYSSTGGSDAWDRNKYLNLWVCALTGGVLGYAQFPGGPAATDGVVIDYRYFELRVLPQLLLIRDVQLRTRWGTGLIYVIYGEMPIVEMILFQILPHNKLLIMVALLFLNPRVEIPPICS